MYNVLTVILSFLVLYAVFAALGFRLSTWIFSSRRRLGVTCAPIFGVAVFAFVSTALMHHVSGQAAGRIAIALCAVFLIVAPLRPAQFREFVPTLKLLLRCHSIGIAAGLIFLVPLIVSADRGIFALNGADFGSYAGWGEFFQQYSLQAGKPSEPPINPTEAGFSNLMLTLVNPTGRWRIGNVSLYAALRSLVSHSMWPTLYTVSIAFFVGQFAIALRLFARHALLQGLSTSLAIAIAFVLLNTIYWLASAHYAPNVIGLAVSMVIMSLLLLRRPRRFDTRMLIGVSMLLGFLWLMYPESITFIPFLLIPQLLWRERANLLAVREWAQSSTLRAVLLAACAVLLSSVWVFESFFHGLRQLKGIIGYSRPGDFVGIHHWAYPSQLLGFADYNSVLFEQSARYLRTAVTVVSVIAIAVIAYLPLATWRGRRENLQLKAVIVLLGSLILMLVPTAVYFWNGQLLLGWRAFLTLSPFVFLLICIAGIKAFRASGWSAVAWRAPAFNLARIFSLRTGNVLATGTFHGFLIVLAACLVFRIASTKAVVQGANHAAIFGEAFQRSTDQLRKDRSSYDLVLIDYQGTGTFQGGWEFFSQDLPYLFSQHGMGRNEFSVEPLLDNRIAIVSDDYKKVHRITGFPTSSTTSFGKTLSLAHTDNVLLPYSSNWIYLSGGPLLLLPGLPGKLLIWLQRDEHACFIYQAKATRPQAWLRLTINSTDALSKPVQDETREQVCSRFHAGLNSIRLEPIYVDASAIAAQKKFVADLAARPGSTWSETERGLFAIYTGSVTEVNPRSAPRAGERGRIWNLITPPDRDPFNPHVLFSWLEVRRQGD